MAPRPLFGRLSWNLFQKSVHSAHRVAVLLDYDGTLTPIRKKPSQATLDSSMRRLLRKLSQRKDLHVGVVTGRSLNNIDQLLRNKALFLVANHGFQVGFRGKTWTHPAARNDAPLLHTIYSQLKRELRDVAAILVEDKVFTLTVHYRNVHKTALPRIRNVIHKILALHQKKLRVTRGKK